MAHSIRQIAEALRAEYAGDGDCVVSGVAEPATARSGQLAVAMTPIFAADLARGQADAAVLWSGADWQALGLRAAIFAPRARLALSRLTGLLHPDDGFEPGTHPTALIDSRAEIGVGASIGPFAVIAAGAVIGPGVRIGAHVSIGREARIGSDARIHAGARIGARVVAGDRLIVQPGAVIGADGFSFVTEGPSNPERAKASGGAETLTPPETPDGHKADGHKADWHKIELLGAVVIGDDVEIGANSTVDAGTIRATRIGSGTKLDNLVQVGHNVVIGEHCLLCAQVGVAGSTVIGNRVVLGGQSGVADHLRIGDDVVTGGASVVLNSVPSGRVLLGYPAQRMDRTIAAYKALRRLIRRDEAEKPVPKAPSSD